ncbi:MAG: FkbM family methyltransferase [Lysobacterales bacterium]
MSADRRQPLRIAAGRLLHACGAYRQLLPVYAPRRGRLRQRLLDYLQHYLQSVPSAEADLYLEPLGAWFACDLNDHMLAPYLQGEAPIYELAEIRFWQQQVRSGDQLLDIGANHGFWGVTLATSTAVGQLHLFEANPAIAARLRRTLSLNRGLPATLHACAVSDGSVDRICFYRPQGNLSGLGSTVLHAYAAAHGYLNADDRIEVPASSIDQLVQRGAIGGIDLVKIDVEQAEDAVVAGAREAFARFQPRMLMVETGARSQATETLRQLGYQVTLLQPDGRERALRDEDWGNLVFRRTA